MRKSPANLALHVVVAALCTGCGASQPPLSTPGAAKIQIVVAKVDRGKKRPSGQELLYAAVSGGYRIYIFSYPEGEFALSLQLKDAITGTLCTDSAGDVFVPAGNVVFEYSFTTEVNTLTEGNDYQAYGCSVDPLTGNLAVANVLLAKRQGVVAIFSRAQGQPKYYRDPTTGTFWECGYDDKGNLFIDGRGATRLQELVRGGTALQNIKVPIKSFGQVQWDGQYITVATNNAQAIYRLKVTGSTAKIVSTTHLMGSTSDRLAQPWIEGNTVIRPFSHHSKYGSKVGLWKYPSGGMHYLVTQPPDKHSDILGVTVSANSGK